MDVAILGLVAILIPLVSITMGLVSNINKTIQAMDKRLADIEVGLDSKNQNNKKII